MREERTPVSRSALLLTETLIAVLFFAVAGAICLQIFAGTHRLTEKTEWLNFAVCEVSSAAELLSNEQGTQENAAMLQCLQKLNPLAQGEEATIRLYYDREKEPCTAAEADAELSVSAVPGDREGLVDYLLSFRSFAEEEPLYVLTVQIYCPSAERSAG